MILLMVPDMDLFLNSLPICVLQARIVPLFLIQLGFTNCGFHVFGYLYFITYFIVVEDGSITHRFGA